MKFTKNILLFLLFFSSILLSQEDKKVLVEVFTNSHCPLCPPAHNVIQDYLSGSNGDKISFIFYHMIYPYNDDPLYWQSQEGSDARDNYYNPVAATPRGWFDGTIQGSTSGWTNTLNNLVSTTSPLKIILSGYSTSTQLNINALLTRSGNIPDNDLVIHFIVVEDIYFDGRNSISNHKQVMRKMLPTTSGKSFSINMNETTDITQTIDLDPLWDTDSLSIVVFVQSWGSKIVYQSEMISYSELIITDINNETFIPSKFRLEQNYPNPFNPSTTIRFSIPESDQVSVKIYNSIGEYVTELVNQALPGGNYRVDWNAENFPSGIYLYTLATNKFNSTKKMILLK